MDRIFNKRYDKKRLAPGLITGKAADRVFHDCSTLGGNSGGEVVSLKTGHALALHFAGTLFAKNHAVPIEVVAQRLDDVLKTGAGRVSIPVTKVPEGSNMQTTPNVQVEGSRIAEVTIPIKVRVEIGDAVFTVPTDVRVGVPTRPPVDARSDADDDLIETTEARPEDYRDRKGYAPAFLGEGFEVPLPVLTRNQEDVLTFAFDGKSGTVLDYHHFSVVMSKGRRMCRFSACNIDGDQSKRTSRAGWQFDPRIPNSAQIMKECYGAEPKFSRGHMTRREDPAWGSDANLGNRDSMHVTNTVPQIQPFNGGIWLDLEDYALQSARKDKMQISVFTGPFLEDSDPIRFGVKVPVIFWKVIAFIHDQTGKLCRDGLYHVAEVVHRRGGVRLRPAREQSASHQGDRTPRRHLVRPARGTRPAQGSARVGGGAPDSCEPDSIPAMSRDWWKEPRVAQAIDTRSTLLSRSAI